MFENRYRRLGAAELEEMHRPMAEQRLRGAVDAETVANLGQSVYSLKFAAEFTRQMNRSVRVLLRAWTPD